MLLPLAIMREEHDGPSAEAPAAGTAASQDKGRRELDESTPERSGSNSTAGCRSESPGEETDTAQSASHAVASSDRGGWRPHPMLGDRAAYGLATLSGVLCPVGFAGIDVWPLSFVAWVPLIVALRGRSVKQALALGWYSGFIMTMIGFYWLIEMLQVFSGFPTALCVLFAAVLCVQMGGRMALMSALYARVAGRGWHHGASLLAAFAVSELVYPLLFPWYYAASVHQVPVMMQTAELGGPIAVTTVILAVNVGVAELLERPLFRRRADRRTVLAGVLLPIAALVFGLVRMSTVDHQSAATPPVRAGLVQGNMPLKHRRGAVGIHIKRTAELRAQGADLVVWSEAAVPRAFSIEDYQRRMKRLVGRHLHVPAIIGGVLYQRIPPAERHGRRRVRLFNSALAIDARGNVVDRYDKQYLLMFGEYLPLGDRFPILYDWSPNSGNFSPGSSYAPLKLGGHQLSTMICYEDILPSFVNQLVASGKPELLVNMTNDAWFGDTTEPWIHLALAKFRAVEHRRYLLRATNSGISAIIDANGRVLKHSDAFKEQTLLAEVHYLHGSTVYEALGNAPWWLATALMALGCALKRRRGQEQAAT